MAMSKLSLLCFDSSIILRDDVLDMKIIEEANERYLTSTLCYLYENFRTHPYKFHTYTGVSVNTFDYILQHIEHLSWQMKSKMVITNAEKLFLTLRFLAHGLSFKSLAVTYRLTPGTIGKTIYQTLHTIWMALKHLHLPQPTENSFKQKSDNFYMKWKFPNCIGAIGAKNFRIMKILKYKTGKKKRKQSVPFVLHAISDADYKFTAIEIEGNGSESDGTPFHFDATKLNKTLAANKFNVPSSQKLPGSDISLPHVLLGGASYPLKTYLLRPYPFLQMDREKRIFNEILLRVRATNDFTFDILTTKWRIFNKPLETSTKHATLIIHVACLLHNIVRDQDGDNDKTYKKCCLSLSQGIYKKVLKSKRNSRTSFEAMEIRDKYKMYFVNNPIENCQLPTSS